MSSSQTTAKVHEFNLTSSPSVVSKSKRSKSSRQSSPNAKSPQLSRTQLLKPDSPKKPKKSDNNVRIVRKIELGQLNPIEERQDSFNVPNLAASPAESTQQEENQLNSAGSKREVEDNINDESRQDRKQVKRSQTFSNLFAKNKDDKNDERCQSLNPQLVEESQNGIETKVKINQMSTNELQKTSSVTNMRKIQIPNKLQKQKSQRTN